MMILMMVKIIVKDLKINFASITKIVNIRWHLVAICVCMFVDQDYCEINTNLVVEIVVVGEDNKLTPFLTSEIKDRLNCIFKHYSLSIFETGNLKIKFLERESFFH